MTKPLAEHHIWPVRMSRHTHLNALDDDRSLTIQFICVSFMTLLLAVLKAAAFVIFQHAMLTAELTLTERAVANNALGLIFTILECAANLLGSTATDWQGDVYGSVCRK